MWNFRKILLLILLIVFMACNERRTSEYTDTNTEMKDNELVASLSFDTTINDMGTINEGEQVISWFDYTNTGDAPLLISDIKAGCGCTVPQWNNKPLEPGGRESIKIVFDSYGKRGIQNIKIVVYSNAKVENQVLYIKSIVNSIN